MDGNFDAWTNSNWFEVWAVLEAGTEHNLNDIDKNIVTIIKDTKIDPTKRWNFFEDEVMVKPHDKTVWLESGNFAFLEHLIEMPWIQSQTFQMSLTVFPILEVGTHLLYVQAVMPWTKLERKNALQLCRK